MAVEIPVVIDIEKGFADAAKRVPAAMKPLKDTIEKLTSDLSKWQGELEKHKIDSAEWENAAKNIQTISQALEVAGDRLKKYTSNDGSIRRMNAELASLSRRWEEMGSSQKFVGSTKELSSDAKKMLEDYRSILNNIKEQGESLSEIVRIEERRSQAVQEVTQRRSYEQAVLNSTGNTLHKLQEQERILSERLNRARIGTRKYEDLRDRLKQVRAEMNRLTSESDKVAYSLINQSGVVTRLSGALASYASIFTAFRLAKQVRDVTGELEYQRVALGHLIQDEEYASTLFQQIKERAVESPFRIKELVTFTKQLAAFRIEQEELFDTMDRLADISAGLGVEMNRLILAYGQVRSASVLRGQELRQFTEAGIPLVQLLADKFTELNGESTKTADVFDLISKRAVPFSMIADIFEDLTDKGGMFYQMQERQAETLKGRWEKLKDAFDIGLQSIGETKTFEAYNKIIIDGLTFLAKNLRLIPKLIEGASAAWVIYHIATTRSRIATRKAAADEIREATAKEAQTIANIKGIRYINAYTNALIRQKVATNALSKSFWKLWAAIVASPIGAILSVIGAVASAWLLFKERTDEAANAYKDLDEIIENTSRGLKDTSKIDNLINRYDELASKTDLSVKESNRLYQTMTLLQDAFPGLQVSVDDTTESIEEQVRKMRELNEERRKELLMRGEEKFQALQDEIIQKEKDRNKLYKEQNRLRANLAQNVAEKGSDAQRTWTKELDNTNDQLSQMDDEIGKLQKRLDALNRILHPDDLNQSLNAWQRFIKDNSGIFINGISTSLFDDEEIEKWENLSVALDEIGKRKKKAQELEDKLSTSIKTQTGEIRDQIQAELDWARVEKQRLEWLENWFSNTNVYQKDISENFRILMRKTFEEGNLKQYGQNLLNYLYMQTGVIPNPELLSRPLVEAAELVSKGWKDAGEGIATVFSVAYDIVDDKSNSRSILVTPILPDGTVLSPEELDNYVYNILSRTDLENDPKKIVLGIDVTPDAGERLHEMQEEFYHLAQLRNSLPEKFLFTEKDVSGIKESTDVIALAESKIESIKKELESVNTINIENLSYDEIRKTDEYKENLREVYDWLVKLKDKFKVQVEFPDIAKDIIDNFEGILGREFKEGGVTIPVNFLITDKELYGLYNVGDLFDLLDKKISEVEQEIEKINEQKIDPNVSEEVIEQSELYRLSLERVYQTLLQIQGRYREQLTDIAKDVKEAFPSLMSSFYRNAEKSGFASQGLFSQDELKRIRSIIDLYDVWVSKLQAVQKAKEDFNNKLSDAIDEQTRRNAQSAIASLTEQERTLLEFMTRYGFLLPGKTSGGESQDPWIILYKNRLKFMRDFQRGVEDLDKYLSHSASLGIEQGFMRGRGLSLGIDTKDLNGTADELRSWYDKTIKDVASKIRSMGGREFAGLGVTEILAKDLTGRKIQKYQELLQELWKGFTDFETSQLTKNIEEKLKRVSDEIKRSETARNFFQDIFDLTGDEQLAANMAVSVYGDPGKELADRIRESIQGAMSAEGIKSDSDTWSRLLGAAAKMDFRDVLKDISSLPEGVQKAVQEASSAIEKYNADIAKSYAKLLMSYDDIEQERVNINQQAARKIKAIESGLQLELRAIAERGGDEGAASAARKRAAEAMLAVEREQRSDLYKLTDEYRLFFNTVNILSVENARSIAAKQKKILADRLANEEISFARYKRELKEIDEQLKKYENRTSPFLLYLKDGLEALMEQSKEAAEDIQGLAASIGKSSIGDGGVFSPDASARAFLDKCDRVFNNGLFDRIFNRKNTITIEQRISAASTQAYNEAYNNAIMRGKSDDVAKAIAQSQAASAASAEASSAAAEAAGAASSAASGVAWAEFWIRLIYSVLSNIDERITKGGKEAAPKWLDYLASGVTWTWGKVGEGAWDKLADVNSHAIKWLEEVKSGDLAGSLFTFGDAIYDIFRSKSVREANREINEQSEIITDLERSYSRLEVAIQDAFGSDYIYNFNRQLELLEMEAEAYRKQAESERSKGKDADEDVAKGYERSAEDVENKIKDMRSQLADFFSGTDAASAAKDFAKAWIEAYKEFGSTTDAISQKFNDMIESMVVNSLAAQLIQGILNPVFEAIDTASKDGALTADDIGAISAMVPGRVAMINDAMNTLMSQLLSTGIDLQRQAGNFTGISRNIASASEESILSLAAGINTQNYYMSHIDINVASILAAITGDETAGQNRAKSSGPTSVQYNEQMLEYASSIPMMRDDMASVRAMLERVIKPVGTPASHYVSARV